MSFQGLHLDPRCLRVLQQQGITEPTPVQERAIPLVWEGRDLVAIAQTGTGKTLAFGLPTLTRLAAAKPGRNRMLVLVPTRELAVQVHAALDLVGRELGLRSLAVYGGVGMERQTRALRRGVDILVACPGRLLDHISRGHISFQSLSLLVLDEADRMLDMGFLPDIKRILVKLPRNRQTLMFSATFPAGIRRLAADFQQDPVRVEVGRIANPVKAVRQGVYTVDPRGKMRLLSRLLAGPGVESALVFLRTKQRTDRVAKALDKAGFKARPIHGGRSQGQRQHALDGFRKGRFRILVATDVAARGLDIRGITHVINYDIPTTSDDYIHRIGRTARASASGDAITFVCPDDHRLLGTIEQALGQTLPRQEWEGAVSVRSGPDRPVLPAGQRRRKVGGRTMNGPRGRRRPGHRP